MYIIILNSDTESVDCLDLSNKPFDVDLFEFVTRNIVLICGHINKKHDNPYTLLKIEEKTEK